MFRQTFAALSLTLTALAADASAQSNYPGPYFIAQQAPQMQLDLQSGQRVVNYASTPIEGWLRGEADWMRGYGDSMRSQAQAAYVYQIAREKQIQNYQRIRARGDAIRAANAKAAAAAASNRRRENTDRQYAALQAAQPLLDSLEASQGSVAWPEALCRPEFTGQLQMVDVCLARWIEQQHSLSRRDRSELKKSLNDLQTHLRHQRRANGSSPELAEARDLLQKIDTLVFQPTGASDRLLAQTTVK